MAERRIKGKCYVITRAALERFMIYELRKKLLKGDWDTFAGEAKQ